jgi:uncharacterized protein YjlB
MTVEHFRVLRKDWVPNNPRLPVIVYRGALSGRAGDLIADKFEQLLGRNG